MYSSNEHCQLYNGVHPHRLQHDWYPDVIKRTHACENCMAIQSTPGQNVFLQSEFLKRPLANGCVEIQLGSLQHSSRPDPWLTKEDTNYSMKRNLVLNERCI
jgi:hypothetical protein